LVAGPRHGCLGSSFPHGGILTPFPGKEKCRVQEAIEKEPPLQRKNNLEKFGKKLDTNPGFANILMSRTHAHLSGEGVGGGKGPE